MVQDDFTIDYPMNTGTTPSLWTVNLSQIRSGDLKCAQCKNTWCKHIAYAIQNDLDTKPLWKMLTEDTADKPEWIWEIKVPMIPDCGLFATVELTEVSKSIWNMQYVYAENARPLSIGYTAEGEGRRIFRSTLFDWVVSVIKWDETCISKTHTFEAQQSWSKDLGGPREMLQRWSVHVTGKCLVCNKKTLMAGDFEDLIPQNENYRSWK